eukprot:15447391-Alexandrium_andersonii.AAC.1
MEREDFQSGSTSSALRKSATAPLLNGQSGMRGCAESVRGVLRLSTAALSRAAPKFDDIIACIRR